MSMQALQYQTTDSRPRLQNGSKGVGQCQVFKQQCGYCFYCDHSFQTIGHFLESPKLEKKYITPKQADYTETIFTFSKEVKRIWYESSRAKFQWLHLDWPNTILVCVVAGASMKSIKRLSCLLDRSTQRG